MALDGIEIEDEVVGPEGEMLEVVGGKEDAAAEGLTVEAKAKHVAHAGPLPAGILADEEVGEEVEAVGFAGTELVLVYGDGVKVG